MMRTLIRYFTIGLFAFCAVSCELDGDEEKEKEEEVKPPQDKTRIADFHPKSVQAGDTLVITGDFPIDTAEINVTFWRYYPAPESEFDVEVLTTSPTKITALVHSYLPNSGNLWVRIYFDNRHYTSDDAVYLKPTFDPYLLFRPRAVRPGEMIEVSGLFKTEPNLQTVRVRFQGTIDEIAPSSIKFNEENGIGYITFRVPSDAETGSVEIFSENHAPSYVQSTLEVLPEMPPLQQGAWVSRADLGWGKVEWVTGACTFTIGSKAYMVGGASFGVFGGEDLGTTNLWEYDPAYNAWRPLAPFPEGNLSYAVAFSINGVGYVGTGRDKDGGGRRDFHAYDPETDSWERKADLPGEGRAHAVGFAVSGNGYIGSGINNDQALDDFYKYSPTSDSWSAIQPNPSARTEAYAFVIGDKAFVGGGANSARLYDLHMLNPETDSWIPKKGWVAQSGRINHIYTSGASTFTIGDAAYVGLGYDHRNSIPFLSTQSVLKYSINTDSWEYFVPFEGSSRTHAIGFAIDGVGYFGLGRAIWLNNTYYDVWGFKF